MTWRDGSRAAQRLELVLAILSRREPVAQVCRRFKVSRQSAYKYLRRFKAEGRRGLEERSRQPTQGGWSKVWRQRVRRLRRRRPTWGACKLRWWLRRRFPRGALPGARTIQRWLQQAGLVRRRREKKRTSAGPHPGPPVSARRANDVWTLDFKGWFRTRSGQRIEPLTIRDLYSRYLLAVVPVPNTAEAHVRKLLTRLFQRFGRPKAIRSDRGAPFCGTGPHGLTKLSVWWVRHGIRVEFVDRARRLDNNAHEQMHRVLKAEVAQARSRAEQVRRLEAWRRDYNHNRPHQSLGNRTPASCYHPRRVQPLPLGKPRYPAHWLTCTVKGKGEIFCHGRRYGIGRAFLGLPVGLRPTGSPLHHVFFGHLLLGSLDLASDHVLRPHKF